MCDYSLTDRKVTCCQCWRETENPALQYGHDRVCCAGRYQHGGLRFSGNRTCLRDCGKVQRTRFVCVEAECGRPHDGHLSASQ